MKKRPAITSSFKTMVQDVKRMSPNVKTNYL